MRSFIIHFLFLIPSLAYGQSWCGAKQYDHANEIGYNNFLSQIRDAEYYSSLHLRSIRYVQVVVHVVARDASQPVTEAQTLQQLDVLNADFAARGANIGKLPPEFLALTENAEIHFCLAKIDPDGNPTSGITFTHTDEPNIALSYGFEGRRVIQYDELGGKTGWDPSRYINIWVGEFGDILGSATMPGEATHDEEIGIVINIAHFGSVGHAGGHSIYGKGHTLTHEMGHFLGLRHIWGMGTDENCDDSDDIEDTPNASGPHYGCPEGNLFSCGVNNMYQNFMDLTDDRCLAAFTHGQVKRMQNVLDNIYPDIIATEPCSMTVTDFDSWYDALVWTMDQSSDKIIVYQQDQLAGDVLVRVFSIDGREVMKMNWESALSSLINLEGVATGVYVVNMEYEGKCRSRKLFVY